MNQDEYNAQFENGEFSVNGGGENNTSSSNFTYGSQKDFNRQFRGGEFSVTHPAERPTSPIIGNIQRFFEGLKSRNLPLDQQYEPQPEEKAENQAFQNFFDFGLNNFSSLYKIKNVSEKPEPLEIEKIKDDEEKKKLTPDWLSLTVGLMGGADNKITIDNRAKQILKQPVNDIISSIQEARRETQPSLQKFAEFYNSPEGKLLRGISGMPVPTDTKKAQEQALKALLEGQKMSLSNVIDKTPGAVGESLGKAKDVLLSTRGYTEEELNEAKPTFKENLVGGAKAVGEIANIIPMGLTAAGAQLSKLGSDDPEYTEGIKKYYGEYLNKSSEALMPNTAGEAKAMRMADILSFGLGGGSKALGKTLVKASTVKEVENVVGKYGLAYSEDTMKKLAQTTDVKKINTILKEAPINKEKALENQLNNYNTTLEKNIKEFQKEGQPITPQVAENINNKTVKEVPIYLDEAVMEVPTNQGVVPIHTQQKLVLQNLIKDREKINYKTVDSLGEDVNGQPITAKFEWDYNKQEGTILSTQKDTTAKIASELGNNFDRKVIAKVNTELKQLLPRYMQNVEKSNAELTAYAVRNLDGDITNKKITQKIESLADNFHKELQALSSKELPSQRLNEAMQKIIVDPEDAAKKAPELTEFVKYNLVDNSPIANEIQQQVYRSGVSPIQIQQTQKKIAQEKLIKEQEGMLQEYERIKEAAKQYTKAPEEKVKTEGINSELQSKEIETLKKEARKYKTADEFEKAISSIYGKAMLSGGTEEKKLAKAIEGIGDFKTFHSTAQEKLAVKKVKTISSVDKRGNIIEKTADGNVVKITNKGGDVLYESEEVVGSYTKSTKKTTGSSQNKKKVADEQNTKKESKSSKTKDKGTDKLRSRVFERMQSENPESLKGELMYDAMKLDKDAEKAVDLISKDSQKAYRIAMGIDESKDVTSTSVNIALAEKALDVGDDSLFAQLTKNRSLAQTRRGQELVAEKGSVTNNSTSRYVKELIAMRLEMVDKKFLKNVRNKMKKSSKKQVAIDKIDEEVKKLQKKMSMKEMDIEAAQKLIDDLSC